MTYGLVVYQCRKITSRKLLGPMQHRSINKRVVIGENEAETTLYCKGLGADLQPSEKLGSEGRKSTTKLHAMHPGLPYIQFLRTHLKTDSSKLLVSPAPENKTIARDLSNKCRNG